MKHLLKTVKIVKLTKAVYCVIQRSTGLQDVHNQMPDFVQHTHDHSTYWFVADDRIFVDVVVDPASWCGTRRVDHRSRQTIVAESVTLGDQWRHVTVTGRIECVHRRRSGTDCDQLTVVAVLSLMTRWWTVVAVGWQPTSRWITITRILIMYTFLSSSSVGL